MWCLRHPTVSPVTSLNIRIARTDWRACCHHLPVPSASLLYNPLLPFELRTSSSASLCPISATYSRVTSLQRHSDAITPGNHLAATYNRKWYSSLWLSGCCYVYPVLCLIPNACLNSSSILSPSTGGKTGFFFSLSISLLLWLFDPKVIHSLKMRVYGITS